MTEKAAANGPIPRGQYFEEFEVGEVVAGFGRTITEADIVGFAGLTGDWNAIHTDAEYAAGTMFGQRIAHGLLGLSIASGLAVQMGFMEGTVDAFLSLDWKFSLPIFIGDTISVKAQVKEKKAVKRLGGGIVTFKVQVVNQEGKAVQKGDWRVLVRSKPDASDA